MIYVAAACFAIPLLYFAYFAAFGLLTEWLIRPAARKPEVYETRQQFALTTDLYNGKVIARSGNKVLVVTSRGCEWLDTVS